jgi:hypothetical protein
MAVKKSRGNAGQPVPANVGGETLAARACERFVQKLLTPRNNHEKIIKNCGSENSENSSKE